MLKRTKVKVIDEDLRVFMALPHCFYDRFNVHWIFQRTTQNCLVYFVKAFVKLSLRTLNFLWITETFVMNLMMAVDMI